MRQPSIKAQLLYDRILIKRAIRAYRAKVAKLKATRPPHARYQVGDRVIHCRTLSMMEVIK